MTWILPRQLHTLVYALDTEALISDLGEQSHVCAQSLLARSKHSPARTWLRKWKRDSWTQHLSGRILKHSLGQSFVAAWTSSLEATPASHSVPPANDLEKTTRDICGPSSQMELLICDPQSAFLKTLKDTFLWDSRKSYETFKDLAIAARSEYSARLKLARRISESGSSSWPTIRASEYKDVGPVGSKSHNHMLEKGYLCAVVTAGPADQGNRSLDGSRRESWPTPTAMEAEKAGNYAQGQMGKSLSAMANRKKLMAWATPRSCSAMAATITPETANDAKRFPNLETQVGKQQWATPRAGKLNPRWVETLMGLPVGWTMPSCASPVTIAPTSCDSSATESSQPPPSVPLTF